MVMQNYKLDTLSKLDTLPTLVLIHGYARSGKTTLLKQLKQRGYHCYSTSDELNDIVCERLKLGPTIRWATIRNLKEKADNQIEKLTFWAFNKKMSCRELKIDTAENCYIPKYGRHVFVKRTLVRQKPKSGYNKPVAFFETIGGEEAEIVKKYYKGNTISVDIRAEGELKGVDIRKLSNQNTIFNDMFGEDNFYEYFMKRVNQCLDN